MHLVTFKMFRYGLVIPGCRNILLTTGVRFSRQLLEQTLKRRHLHNSAVRMQDTRPPGHSQLRLDQLKLMNFTMSVNEDKVEATVHTSGLNYSDFDAKNGQPKPHQMLKLTESARFFSHHWPLDETGRTFRDYADLTSDRMTFLVTSRFDITKDMYNVKVPKNPLDLVITGGHIGNTSLSSIAEAFTKDGVKLLSNINHVVSIDKQSRRPFPLPDWWKGKYAKSAERHKPLKFEKQDMTSYDLDPYKIHVVRSDLDGNGHANWSCYVRFSVDGIYNFSKKGKLPNFPDIDRRVIKSMELMFSGESFDEDILDVYAWAPEGSINIVFVHIFKNSEFIFQGRYEYFDGE